MFYEVGNLEELLHEELALMMGDGGRNRFCMQVIVLKFQCVGNISEWWAR